MVTMIMGLLVMLAATNVDFMVPKYRLRAAAREVAAAFKMGKARAAASGKDVYVELDLSQGRYWLLVAFPKQKDDGTFDVEPRGMEYQPILESALPEGVEFTDVILGPKERFDRGLVRVRLAPFAMSNHAIVNLHNKEDRLAAVKFNGFTGYISFYEEHKDAEELIEDQGP